MPAEKAIVTTNYYKADDATKNAAYNEYTGEFSECVQAVANMLAKNPVYSTFVKFTCNGFTIDTRQDDVFTNLVVSFSNKKNGSTMANQFQLVVSFVPDFYSKGNVNALETALTFTSDMSINARKCSLSYGYAHEASMRTADYEGMLLKYLVNFENGVMTYTLTGYSSLVSSVEERLAIPVKDIAQAVEGAEGLEVEEGGESQFEDVDLNNDGDTDDSIDLVGPMPDGSTLQAHESAEDQLAAEVVSGGADIKAQPTLIAEFIVNKYLSEYQCEFGNILGTSVRASDAQVTISTIPEMTALEALKWILDRAMHKSQSDSGTTVSDQQKIKYSYIVSDYTYNGRKPTIRIVANSPESAPEPLKDLPVYWGVGGSNPLANIAYTFTPEYDGSVIASLWQVYYKQAVAKVKEEATEAAVAEATSDHTTKILGYESEIAHAEAALGKTNVGASIGALKQSEYAASENLDEVGWYSVTVGDDHWVRKEMPRREYYQWLLDNRNDLINKEKSEIANIEEETAKRTSDMFEGAGSFFVKNDGTLELSAETTAPIAGGDAQLVKDNIEHLRASWVEAVQYPYKATLQTAGIPCELPVTEHIQVNVILGYSSSEWDESTLHHTSGKYMITGSEDRIEGGQFYTIWNLMKATTDAQKSIYEAAKSDSEAAQAEIKNQFEQGGEGGE